MQICSKSYFIKAKILENPSFLDLNGFGDFIYYLWKHTGSSAYDAIIKEMAVG